MGKIYEQKSMRSAVSEEDFLLWLRSEIEVDVQKVFLTAPDEMLVEDLFGNKFSVKVRNITDN